MTDDPLIKAYLQNVTELSPEDYKKNTENLIELNRRYERAIDLILSHPDLVNEVLKKIKEVIDAGSALAPLSERYGARGVSPYDLAAEIQEAYETSSKLLAVGYLGLIRDKIKKIKLSRHIYWEVTKEQSLDPKIVEAIEEFNSLRDRCITDNLSLVVNFATMYKKFTPISLLDLVQEGNLGLMRALDKYDPEKASQFSTYAVYWIKQFILRYIKKNKRVVRLPSHHQDQVAKMDQENISVEEIAEKLQVSLQVASDIRRTIRTPFSLTNETYSTNIPDESVPLDDHVHEITKTKKLRQRLRKLLSFVEWQVITAEMEGTTIKVDNKQELLKSARAKLAKDEALIRELREITR